jgi:hypothetical protein
MSEPAEIRCKLLAAGFSPLSLIGKRPPLKERQKRTNATTDEIDWWERTYPAAANTGILTKRGRPLTMPASPTRTGELLTANIVGDDDGLFAGTPQTYRHRGQPRRTLSHA